MKLSIVTTLYQSATHVQPFYERASAVAKKLAGDDYEIIFVNDGSPDNSLEISVQLTESDPHIIVIDLSRNFGHHKAMMTGMAAATGNYVFLIDSDLEEEPEYLLSFYKQLCDEYSDVVYGVQMKRRGGPFGRILGNLFYRMFRFFTGIDQPNDITTARLMTNRYVKALIAHQEREINIGALWLITGFKQSCQSIIKHSNSPTTYTFRKKISHAVNAITSFSSAPLVYTFYAGLFISVSAIIYISYLVFRYFYIATLPTGYTSTIASIWLFSGLIIFFMGVQGVYIAKIFSEVKQRPYTIIRNIYKNTST